jgi:serine/threonine-protein kinase
MPPADVGSGPRFRTAEIAGRDRLGTLWAGTDVRTGTAVTVRVLAEGLTTDRERVRRADVRLRRLRADVTGPHLARVLDHDLQTAADRPAFVVSEARGETLAARLARGGAFAVPAALAVVADVAEGLAVAHAAWIQHGALSASSVLLRDDGRAVVIDVGLGELLGGSSDGGGPATAANLTDRSAADVYAVAALFEQLVAGTEEPPPPAERDVLRPWERDVSTEVGAVLRGALSPHRLLRPDMAEVAGVLAAARGSMAPAAEPPVATPAPAFLPPVERPVPARSDAAEGGPALPAPPEAVPARAAAAAEPPARGARGGRHRARRRILVGAVIGASLLAVAAGGFLALRSVRGTERDRPPAASPSASPVSNGSPSASPTSAIEATTVPDVLGRRTGRATLMLERAGLVLGEVIEVAGDQGRVVRTDPTPGETVVVGTTVILFVGDGSGR